MPKLTKRVIEARQAGPARYDIWDSELRGFGLRVETSGTKTFIIRYRADGGGRSAPRRFMTVGRYATLSIDQARARARQLLGAAQTGADPARERSNKRKEMTVAELLTFYAKDGTSHLKPLTRKCTLARLANHVLPELGTKKISDVTTGDVVRMAAHIAAGKTCKDVKTGYRTRVIVRGGEGAAAKSVRDLSAVFSFAKSHRLVVENPCDKARKRADASRDTFLTIEQLHGLGCALDQLAGEGANRSAICIIRLLALTGCRRNEIAGLTWDEVDLDHACLRLGNTKTGKSVRPLGAPAIDILNELQIAQSTQKSKWVFPATSGSSHLQGIKRIWPRALLLAGLSGVTLHTLRHTFASHAASNGESLPMIGALLGHSNARSTSRYAHIANDPKAAAVKRHSQRIDAAMRGVDSV